MKVGSTAGVISGLSPGTEKDGEDLLTTYVPNGTTDIIIIINIIIKTRTLLRVSCASRASDVREPRCGHPWYIAII
jgi:hypothetical protein